MTATLNGLILLFAALFLGDCLQTLWLHSIPGPVLGMVFMLAFLVLKGRPPPGLDEVAQWFIRYLSLFFIPAAVGLWFLHSDVRQQWPAILVATIPATVITQILVAFLFKALLTQSGERE